MSLPQPGIESRFVHQVNQDHQVHQEEKENEFIGEEITNSRSQRARKFNHNKKETNVIRNISPGHNFNVDMGEL